MLTDIFYFFGILICNFFEIYINTCSEIQELDLITR